LNGRRDSVRPRGIRHEHAPAITRAGLIGDVHTEHRRLESALALYAREGLERILCTGDIPDGPNDARAVEACCAALIRSRATVILGNHDRWLQDGEMRDLTGATDLDELSPEALGFLAAIPATVEFETPSGRALLCHGLGADDMASVQPFDHGLALDQNEPLQALLEERRYRYVISGHTHRPMVRDVSGLTIINAGTLLRDHNPCCAVVDFAARRIQFYDVGEQDAPREGVEWAL
jgi:predicted phosphodiesterase